jgi:hypothetical protein
VIVPIETLIAKEVRDAAGRRAGRLVEVHGHERGREFLVTHYVLVKGWLGYMLHELGVQRGRTRRRVPWEQMDFSDPLHPRLTCSVAELKAAR